MGGQSEKEGELLIYINGALVPKSEAKISVFDHGLLYGDGVFEGIRAYGGKVFRLEEHIDRLYESAHCIWLKIPMTKEEMQQAILQTLRANCFKDAYIRVVVTRGVGDLGLDPWRCSNPSVIIIADRIEVFPSEFYERGIEAIIVSTRRNSPQALNPAIKSLNYLNNIFAKIEAKVAGKQEAIMLTIDGYVAEGSGENIFIVKNGCLHTPPAYMGILRGITRGVVMELACRFNIPAYETVLTARDLYTADECFLTGTGAEIVPIVAIDGRPIGDGKPGRITRQLMEAFRELTLNEGTPIY
ncbi:MAG: branched-chain-amino-acid transaminase [Armatimonadota bacterium]|nr:branched-chain-amino-acid transaminase [Armatimonadota bacterium]MCX7778197.1 branched-chain-amino-acid transaminase [Armatimonadota bacterium]MDW8025689.1 branched-chain-amino-acid transaminase [Armatimonadota bacterium]